MIKEEREFLCDECIDIDYCTTRCKLQEQLSENVQDIREETPRKLSRSTLKEIRSSLGFSRVSSNGGKF